MSARSRDPAQRYEELPKNSNHCDLNADSDVAVASCT